MRRLAVSVALIVLIAPSVTFAQTPRTYARVTQPEREQLEKLNLKIDWVVNIPVGGKRDGLAEIQLIDETQMFVQTRGGSLIAVDAVTGRQQWTFRYPFEYPSIFPVAVNSKFVFALNVARLFVFNRLTGAIEMEYNLPAAPSTGPTVDFEHLYIAYTSKSVQCFALPQTLRQAAMPQEVRAAELADPRRALLGPTPAKSSDDVARDYATRRNIAQPVDLEIDRLQIPKGYLDDNGGEGSKPNRPNSSPSLTAASSVFPPYNLKGLVKVESLQILPSLHRPYKLKPDYMNYNQRTPSIGAIPPSVARLNELANLQPPALEPRKTWQYGPGGRINYPPVLVGYPVSTYLWVPTESPRLTAVKAISGPAYGSGAIAGELNATPAAAMSQPVALGPNTLNGYIPLADGELLAVDLFSGSDAGVRILWRANIGGLLNRQPLVSRDGVYAFGDASGVVRMDIATGEVNWRTDTAADRLLAVNDEYIYVLDRRNQLLVYGKNQAVDAKTKKARPVGTMNIVGLSVPITNYVTDRILMGAENGLIVCVRNSAAKYARATTISMPTHFVVEKPKVDPKPMMPVDPAEPK